MKLNNKNLNEKRIIDILSLNNIDNEIVSIKYQNYNKIFIKIRENETFFSNEYLPNARSDIAVSSLPNGKKYYQFLVKDYTTTSLSIQEIHNTGLA